LRKREAMLPVEQILRITYAADKQRDDQATKTKGISQRGR
jgi:hypothetical protein